MPLRQKTFTYSLQTERHRGQFDWNLLKKCCCMDSTNVMPIIKLFCVLPLTPPVGQQMGLPEVV